jgi:DNA-binding IclR family transcriptional regulator
LNSKKRATGRDKKGKSAYNPVVPAVEQASRILLFLEESPHFKVKLTEICQQVGIHKSKAFSILNTLKQFGFVEKDSQTKTYSLGTRLVFLARNVLDNLYYPDIVAPFLQNLAIETSGTAVFGLINGEHVFVVSKHEGNQNIGFSVRLGHRFHITLGAHGKAIVAFMPDAEKEKILARKKVYFYWEPSGVNMKLLREELARSRELGFAQDIGKITPGVNVVSAPLFAHHDKIIGCLILIGTFQESMIDQYGPKVVHAAKQISIKLGADVEHLYPF